MLLQFVDFRDQRLAAFRHLGLRMAGGVVWYEIQAGSAVVRREDSLGR